MKLRLIVCCLLLSIGSIWAKDDARKASEALIKRVIPEKSLFVQSGNAPGERWKRLF